MVFQLENSVQEAMTNCVFWLSLTDPIALFCFLRTVLLSRVFGSQKPMEVMFLLLEENLF